MKVMMMKVRGTDGRERAELTSRMTMMQCQQCRRAMQNFQQHLLRWCYCERTRHCCSSEQQGEVTRYNATRATHRLRFDHRHRGHCCCCCCCYRPPPRYAVYVWYLLYTVRSGPRVPSPPRHPSRHPSATTRTTTTCSVRTSAGEDSAGASQVQAHRRVRVRARRDTTPPSPTPATPTAHGDDGVC